MGNFFLFLAFCLSSFSFILFSILIKFRDIKGYKVAARAFYMSTALIACSLVSLCLEITKYDFRLKIAAKYGDKSASVFYNLASVLISESGFLVVWALLLSIFVSFLLLRGNYKKDNLFPYVTVILLFIVTFLLVLVNGITNPFDVVASIPENGRGLHPALKYPVFLIIHPLILLFGYIGFTYTFAYSQAALMSNSKGADWILKTRFSTILSWFLLLASALVGSNWAYHVKEWGSFWRWDPVENASLVPIFFSTAYLHSIIIQEKRGMLKLWNIVLIVLTFISMLIATYVSRSKYIPTAHFFSQSSSAPYFLILAAAFTFFSFFVIIKRLKLLKSDNRLEAVLSKESSFLFNNLLFTVIAFSLLWGILFPFVSAGVGKIVNVGPLFYQQIIIPIGLCLLLLTGVCTQLAWKKTSKKNFINNIKIPSAVAIIGGVFAYFMGLHEITVLATFVFSLFVLISIVYEFSKGLSLRKESNILLALHGLVLREKRKYGGYIIHLGIVCILLGISGSAYNVKKTFTLIPGRTVVIKDYIVDYEKIDDDYTDIGNMFTLTLNLSFKKDGEVKKILKPQMEIHREWGAYGRSAVYSTAFEDVYAIWKGYSTSTGEVTFDMGVYPLIRWIWLGGWIVLFGTLIALIPQKKRRV